MYLPRSLLVFLLSPILAVLQIFPITGVVLMMVAAAAFHAGIINAGMFLLAAEAIAVRKFVWLIVPAVWFGAYGHMAWQSHAEIAAFEEFVAHENYGTRIEFNQPTQALIIESSGILHRFSQNLLDDYSVTEIFDSNVYGVTRKRLANASTCATATKIIPPYLGAPPVSPVREPNGRFDSKLPGVCWITSHEKPDREELRVTSTHEDGKFNASLPYSIDRVQISSLKGLISQAAQARAHPYVWFPTPFFGCGLISGGTPRWECTGYFMKDTIQVGPNLLDQTIAALGLRKSPLVERANSVAATENNEFEYSSDEVTHLTSAISNFFQDAGSQLSQHDLNRILVRKDFYEPYTMELSEALCRGAANGDEAKIGAISSLMRNLTSAVICPAFNQMSCVGSWVMRRTHDTLRRAATQSRCLTRFGQCRKASKNCATNEERVARPNSAK